MRKGRFASVSGSPDTVAPLSLLDLLLVDILAGDGQSDERIGIERVRTLAHSAAFLLAGHCAAGATIVASLLSAGREVALTALLVPLAAVLALDLGFWFTTRRHRTRKLRPHLVIRFAVIYVLALGILWSLLVAPIFAGLAPEHGAAIRTVLTIGFALPVAAFLSIPIIVVANTLLTIAAALIFLGDPLLTGGVASLGAAVSWFSLFSARDAVLSSNRRLAVEWEAQKARRFVAEFEQSGRGWFWETDAGGALSYVSDQLAEDFDLPAAELLGRPFADLLMVENSGSAEASERTLTFHLSARFHFSDVTVRADTEKDVWWSLSGSPNFDDYGRFLGFRGIGTDLTEKRRSGGGDQPPRAL
jgi:PAS domain S-box-containing protein